MADNAGQTTYAGHDKLMVVASNYWRTRPPPRVEHQNQVHLPNLVRFSGCFPDDGIDSAAKAGSTNDGCCSIVTLIN
jgi:hypothetical protein